MWVAECECGATHKEASRDYARLWARTHAHRHRSWEKKARREERRLERSAHSVSELRDAVAQV